ncbi:MAG: alpha/beta hydrolase [Planctomycetes bacterium]|nr:alpha/beta hydrolase [Planctomycetota bacterium]
MARQWIILAGLALAGVLGGCAGKPYVTGERLDRGLVLVFTGIEGRSPLNTAICDGLAAGDVPYAIEPVDWTVPGVALYNLRAEQRNRRQARKMARRIEDYRRRYPARPVVLVGHSGGGAMAVWTAEALEEGAKVDGLILLAAALSPDYPLAEAVSRSRRGIVNFHSDSDVLFLGAGTILAGTMDGQHTSSAGRVGFNLPSDGDASAWTARVYQIPHRPEMSAAGHWGGHTSVVAADFVSRYVAPLVRAPQWDAAFIDGVAGGDAAATLSTDASAVYRRY